MANTTVAVTLNVFAYKTFGLATLDAACVAEVLQIRIRSTLINIIIIIDIEEK